MVSAARALLANASDNAFTRTLQHHFDIPVGEYMAKLWTYRPDQPWDPAFAAALRTELQLQGLSESENEALSRRLEQERTMQTLAHTAFTNGAGSLGANWLSCLGQETAPICVAACYSGIPFSNESRPGCLNFSSPTGLEDFLEPDSTHLRQARAAAAQRARDTGAQRLSLVPTRLSRSCVYGSELLPYSREILAGLKPRWRRLLPPLPPNMPFLRAATRFAAALDSEVLGRRVLYLDMCALVARYLELVWRDERHPLTRLCFEPEHWRVIEAVLGHQAIFWRGGHDGARFQIALTPPSSEAALGALVAGQLCPGLFLTFAALAFQNGFQCLGGYNQVQYLARFRSALEATGLFPADTLARVPVSSLALGRSCDKAGRSLTSLDIVLGQQAILDPAMPFGAFAAPSVLNAPQHLIGPT